MKKQSLFLTFALAFTFFTYLVGRPTIVNAGSANITGGSEDSTSSSGENFNPENLQSPGELVPGVNVELRSNGRISVSTEVQNILNRIIVNRFSQTSSANSPTYVIIVILRGDSNAEVAANEVQIRFVNLGAPPKRVQSLLVALLGLTRSKSASILGVPVGQLQPVQLVASTKRLMGDLMIAQKGETPNVDIQNLSDAINAYNNIVMESSPEVLQKLAKDPQFLEVGKLLKQLRAALNKS
ncbi:hypothetical protein [Nostoc sp.]|uniref:hypothetical protein n=1 Tax=Nostoc sp. TaxID=1180 RepID=UPI0035946D7B